MIGRIYIEGQIGTTHNEDGTVNVKGVELADVIAQYQKYKDAEKVFCHITSPGGLVDVGRKIAKYIASLPNVYTVADGECASIATEIHLAVPIERRQMVAGTNYHIHQPMFSIERGVALNKDELADMSEVIGKTQTEMVSKYAKATGMDKVALESLMEQKTSLTDEQVKEFGFVSEIVAPDFKAVALLEPKKSQKEDKMSELTEEIKALRLQVASFVAGKKVEPKKVALDLTTNDGVTVMVVTEADSPAVGDAVTDAEGNAVADGTYDFEMGQLVVAEGVITEIIPAETEEVADVTALKEENDNLKSENEEVKAEVAELRKDIEKMAKLQSTYKPKQQQVAFKKVGEEPTEDKGNAIRERRKAKKEKKTA